MPRRAWRGSTTICSRPSEHPAVRLVLSPEDSAQVRALAERFGWYTDRRRQARRVRLVATLIGLLLVLLLVTVLARSCFVEGWSPQSNELSPERPSTSPMVDLRVLAIGRACSDPCAPSWPVLDSKIPLASTSMVPRMPDSGTMRAGGTSNTAGRLRPTRAHGRWPVRARRHRSVSDEVGTLGRLLIADVQRRTWSLQRTEPAIVPGPPSGGPYDLQPGKIASLALLSLAARPVTRRSRRCAWSRSGRVPSGGCPRANRPRCA